MSIWKVHLYLFNFNSVKNIFWWHKICSFPCRQAGREKNCTDTIKYVEAVSRVVMLVISFTHTLKKEKCTKLTKHKYPMNMLPLFYLILFFRIQIIYRYLFFKKTKQGLPGNYKLKYYSRWRIFLEITSFPCWHSVPHSRQYDWFPYMSLGYRHYCIPGKVEMEVDFSTWCWLKTTTDVSSPKIRLVRVGGFENHKR